MGNPRRPRRHTKKDVVARWFSTPPAKVRTRLERLDELGRATAELKTGAETSEHMMKTLAELVTLGVPPVASALYACALPRRPYLSSMLERLELEDDEIVELLTQFTRRETKHAYPVLDLSRQELTAIPEQIVRVPMDTAVIPALSGPIVYKELNLGYNRLSRLTRRDFQLLNHFEGIHLIALEMKRLPAHVKELTNAIMLNFSWSDLKELPAELCSLKRLRFLKLNWTRVATLPARIGKLALLSSVELAETPLLAAMDPLDGRPATAAEKQAARVRKTLTDLDCEILG